MFIAIVYYFSTRLVLGHFALPEVFYIVIFSVIYIINSPLSTLKFKIQKCILVIIILLLLLNFISISIAHNNNLVQKDNYHYIIIASTWAYSNLDGHIFFPDQLTFAWSFIKYCEYFGSTDVTPMYLKKEDIINLSLSKVFIDSRSYLRAGPSSSLSLSLCQHAKAVIQPAEH